MTKSTPRASLPLWRWDPFLVAVVLGLSIVAGIFQRIAVPVVSQVMVIVLLVIAVAAALVLLAPFAVPRLRRDAEGSLTLTERTVLLPVSESSPRETFPVVDSARYQASIDAAYARSGGPHVAVLVPRATRWLRRDYRVAVDLLIGTRLYRAGFLPQQIDRHLDTRLIGLAERHEFVTVDVLIRQTKRPYSLTVELPESLLQTEPRTTKE
ncbi:hypothetical protein KPL76_12300 [Subtercola sp. PAMC28395]|uniref:hypothetical protein n=1 Tax=Subtercola sp. PAMC28395 TaxID=2846775 RepID=UPI001C0CB9F0|nr:hypothetical protein [Subtercola sp. PAMC28395]QWT23487.1 hypothetical protein KPL76_12300 [Subtercola sp. PAMC28395]